jgi:hypothetical protein
MNISKELTLTNFHFWSGAKDHSFTYTELNEIESLFLCYYASA